VDSSLAAVLVATTPLWIGLFALLLPHGERLSLRGWLGLFFGLAGVTLLLEPGLRQTSDVNLFAVALVLSSAASWALGSLLLRRAQLRVTHLTAAGYEMLLGGMSLNLIGLALGETQQLPEQLAPGAIAVFLYLLLIGSLTGFVAFNWLLGHVPATKVGTYAYVNPLVAVLIGWFFGEAVTGRLWAGIGVILVGVFLVRGADRPLAKRREETAEQTGALPLAQET
jgi:drug/metabolite transporter (DMT)-like permease